MKTIDNNRLTTIKLSITVKITNKIHKRINKKITINYRFLLAVFFCPAFWITVFTVLFPVFFLFLDL